MKDKQHIAQELDLLQEISRVEAPPFLLTRIKAKIDAAQQIVPSTWKWGLASTCLILLALNFLVIQKELSSTESGNLVESMGLESNNEIYWNYE